jgi:hypothetical protein
MRSDQVNRFNVRPDPDPRHLLCYGRTSDSMLDLPDLGGTGRSLQIHQRHLVPFHQTQLYNTEGTVLPIIYTLWEGNQLISHKFTVIAVMLLNRTGGVVRALKPPLGGQHPVLGQVGGGWALEISTFLGPKWHSPIGSMPFHRAQKSLDFQGPTPSHLLS